ncbi:MAG: esterase, partial [Clostridia bacterium]|nr:esterase [Clostridia bacterium]
ECVVPDWDGDLSPWTAPPVFGKEPFGGNAKETLEKILRICPEGNICVLGGYSLAGLFALWAATETDRFSGVAAASPSMWFPGFTDHLRNHPVKTRAVCLSLGDREEKAKNPVMATVGDRIREGYGILKEQVGAVTLEWNEGNHFREPDVRTAKAFAWVLNALRDAGS